MLEDGGENNEERLEVTRDSRRFYGRRYSTHDLVGEVLSHRERPDYYDNRLACRLAEGFRGKPRIEQFTIDRRGAMGLRSVLERSVE